jgi:hypothetical protein
MKIDNNKNGYALQRQWEEFVEKTTFGVKPLHHALYFTMIILNNKFDWKETFGLPTKNTMNYLGVKNYAYYKNALEDLVKWGIVDLHERSKNQWTSNQISLNLLQRLTSKQGVKQCCHRQTVKTIIKGQKPKDEKHIPRYDGFPEH